MVQVEFKYFEIKDNDYTGVEIFIKDNNSIVLAGYSNFDADGYDKDDVWSNQAETFLLPSFEVAAAMVASSGNYTRIM